MDGHGAEVVNGHRDRVFGPKGLPSERLDLLADEDRQRPQTDGRRRARLMLEAGSFAGLAKQGGAAFQIDGEADVQGVIDVAATADTRAWALPADILLIPLLIVEHFEAFGPEKPGSRWSPSFCNQCRTQ